MANQQSGAAGFNPIPSGSLFLNTNQNDIADITETLVLLDTIRTKFSDGIENIETHNIITGVSGYYSIIGQICYGGVIAAKLYEARLKVGAFLVGQVSIHSSNTEALRVPVSAIVYVNAADNIGLYAFVYVDAATVDILAGGAATFLTVQRVR